MRMTLTVLCTLFLAASAAVAQGTRQTPASIESQKLIVPGGGGTVSSDTVVTDTVVRDTIAIPGLNANAPAGARPVFVPGPIAQAFTPPPFRPMPVDPRIPSGPSTIPAGPGTIAGGTPMPSSSTVAGTNGLVPSTTAGMTGLTPSTVAGTTGLVPSTTGGMSPLFRPAVFGAPLIIPPGIASGATGSVTPTDLGPSAPFGVPLRAPPPPFVTGGAGASATPSTFGR